MEASGGRHRISGPATGAHGAACCQACPIPRFPCGFRRQPPGKRPDPTDSVHETQDLLENRGGNFPTRKSVSEGREVVLTETQAFDRDGKGALDVSDLAGLLRVVQGIPGRRPSSVDAGTASVRTGLGTTGASAAGLGVEAAMDAMDEDHSGQV